MAITQQDLDDYAKITNKLCGEVLELGKYFMELHHLDERYLGICPMDDYRGVRVEYRDDYEVHSDFEWSLVDLLDPEKIKMSMRHRKEADELREKEKFRKAESSKIDYEKAEFERLKLKYGNKLPS